MPDSMILDRQVVPRRWQLIDALPAEGEASPILPLTAYLALAPEARVGVGVSLANTDDLTQVLDHLEALPVIALAFPSWRDGRAYSQARKLRHLHGFRGVLLAHGDVLRDQLLYMSRVGFNAFHMRDDQDLQASLRAFALYSAYYPYGARSRCRSELVFARGLGGGGPTAGANEVTVALGAGLRQAPPAPDRPGLEVSCRRSSPASRRSRSPLSSSRAAATRRPPRPPIHRVSMA